MTDMVRALGGKAWLGAVLAVWVGHGARAADSPELARLVDRYEAVLDGGADASGFADPSPDALARRTRAEDTILAALEAMPPAGLGLGDAARREALLWSLRSSRAVRVCRPELWDVDHINGWQAKLPQRYDALAVGTPSERSAALGQADGLGVHVNGLVGNLERGLKLGYAMPRSVVVRVVAEIDRLIAVDAAQSPLYVPGVHARDADFARGWRARVKAAVLPALRRYRDYLSTVYLPRARQSLGVSALPDGEACYDALLRRATSLSLSPQQTYDLGQAEAARSWRELSAIGQTRFGLSDPGAILQKASQAPDNHVRSAGDLVALATSALARTVRLSRPLFLVLPAQPVRAEVEPDYQKGAGIPTHYEAVADASQPAIYRISVDDLAGQTVGAVEVTASHETVPGHHMQMATARALRARQVYGELAYNTAYVEGWANYAERLAEETGIYTSDYARIFRRAVFGRSLVIDPGIHAFGWSRDRALAYVRAAGMSAEAAEDLVDRIAVQPGQLTAYESGGLAIWRLREEARAQQGARFILAAFHQRVLERGVTTLDALAAYVHAWTRLVMARPASSRQLGDSR